MAPGGMGWACTAKAEKAAPKTRRLDNMRRDKGADRWRRSTGWVDKGFRFTMVPSGGIDGRGMLRALRVGSLRLR